MPATSPEEIHSLIEAFNAGDLGAFTELHDDGAWRVEYAHLGALQASSPTSPSGPDGEQS
jgi:hypothetical protein